MPATLTEKDFSQNVNTKFRVNADLPDPVELDLVEVKPYIKNKPGEDSERGFSLFFKGPIDVFLQQATYPLVHEQLGEMDIFLVPIEREEDGFRYEAVFN